MIANARIGKANIEVRIGTTTDSTFTATYPISPNYIHMLFKASLFIFVSVILKVSMVSDNS